MTPEPDQSAQIHQLARVRRFVAGVWRFRSLIVRSPIAWGTIRAMWIQSDPDWFSKQPTLDLSDDEADAFLSALDQKQEP